MEKISELANSGAKEISSTSFEEDKMKFNK